jgi:hypothetical protein
MVKRASSVALAVTAVAASLALSLAGAQVARADDETPVPPYVEDAPVAAGNGYCYAGPHPVDTRVAAGGPWDATQTAHVHNYPPFDLRLFVLRDGCYHFIGDPRDFGYTGQTYAYYGAHPIHDHYGGSWCFMIGGHGHWWRPWSPYFITAGPWYYWQGPYDPYFWAYWPYYSHYYGAYYPHYYGGGRFWRGRGHRRGGDWAVAPPIGRTARPPAMAGAPPAGGTGMAAPRGGGTARPAPAMPPGRALPHNGAWTTPGVTSTQQPRSWGSTGTFGGSYARPSTSGGFGTPSAPAPAPTFRNDNVYRGSMGSGGSSFGSARPFGGGSFRNSAPAPAVRAAPSGGGGLRGRSR